MNSNSLLSHLNRLEEWLDETKSKYHLFPLRIAGYLYLFVMLMVSNFIAIIRWPIVSVKRKVTGGNTNSVDQVLNDSVNEVDPEGLEQILQSPGPVLIDFWAEWCGPCIMMNRPLKKLAESESIDCTIVKIDTVKHGDLADKYNVKGLPTLLLVEGNNELKRNAGALSYHELKKFVRR
jgi:thioredoxin